jgi:hypothetical protein
LFLELKLALHFEGESAAAARRQLQEAAVIVDQRKGKYIQIVHKKEEPAPATKYPLLTKTRVQRGVQMQSTLVPVPLDGSCGLARSAVPMHKHLFMRHRPKRSCPFQNGYPLHAMRIAPTALFSLSFAAVYKTIAAAFRKFNQDDGTFLASGLAFGLLLYSVPFTLLTLSALSYTAVQSDTALAWIRRISLNLVPHSRDLFDSFITDVVKRRGLLGFSGFIAFLFFSRFQNGHSGSICSRHKQPRPSTAR